MDKRILSDEELLGIIKKNAGGGGGGGTTNYNELENKPQIAGNTLSGNKSLADLGIASAQSVSNITNGESINNFADVETALSNKQGKLTAGDYISILQNEISVNREIPANNYSYEIVTKSTGGNDASVTIKKYANGTLVSSTDYIYNQTGTVNVDGYFTFQWVSGWRYTLLQASTTHAEGYTASWSYLDVVDFTEVFPTEDTSGLKLVIKSELDTALDTKQDTLTFDDTPTDGSNNPVKSNGVYDALATKTNTDMVAADFNAGTSYTAGNYCIYEGKFYKFKNNHSGAWAAADVDEIKIAGELSSLKSGLTSVATTMPNQIPPNDTPNNFNDMYDRAITMYRIGDTTSMTNAPATGLYGVVISYRFGAYILQAFHHSNGMYQRFSFDSGATWGTWLQIK